MTGKLSDKTINVLKYTIGMCRFNPLTGETTPMDKDCKELADACEEVLNLYRSQTDKSNILNDISYLCSHTPSCDGCVLQRDDAYGMCILKQCPDDWDIEKIHKIVEDWKESENTSLSELQL